MNDLPLYALLLLYQWVIHPHIFNDHPLGISSEEDKVLVDEAESNVNGHVGTESVYILLEFDHQHIVAYVVVVKLSSPLIDCGQLVPFRRLAILNANDLNLIITRCTVHHKMIGVLYHSLLEAMD